MYKSPYLTMIHNNKLIKLLISDVCGYDVKFDLATSRKIQKVTCNFTSQSKEQQKLSLHLIVKFTKCKLAHFTFLLSELNLKKVFLT